MVRLIKFKIKCRRKKECKEGKQREGQLECRLFGKSLRQYYPRMMRASPGSTR